MNIAVIGLGLIGGSFAKACKRANHTVMGLDKEKSVVLKAKLLNAIDKEIDVLELDKADIVIIALYKGDVIKFVKDNSDKFSKDAVVLDCTGTKRSVCKEIEPIATKKGFHFIGAHPMAGREYSGFDYSMDNLFENASILLTPSENIPIKILSDIKKFFSKLGFLEIVITSPEKHDQIIAYTSELAHVVSNTYVKSPMAQKHGGFSAGSFKDLTRVAKLNVKMWTELFIDNKDNLVNELDILIKNLQIFKDALKEGNEKEISNLLEQGVKCKENADKQ